MRRARIRILLMLAFLPWWACDCSDRAERQAYCDEVGCEDSDCVSDIATSGDDFSSTTVAYCRPRDPDVCPDRPSTGRDAEGRCFSAPTECLPTQLDPVHCTPGTIAEDDDDAQEDDEQDEREQEGESDDTPVQDPDWANHGPGGQSCPDGCPAGGECVAGVCVKPCAPPEPCGENEVCVLSEEGVGTCAATLLCSGGGGSWDIDREGCSHEWTECDDGSDYFLECVGDEEGLLCTCFRDEAEVASFRWHDAACFCQIAQVVQRGCDLRLWHPHEECYGP